LSPSIRSSWRVRRGVTNGCTRIKFDGYRVQLRVEQKRPAVRTREGHDWTDRFANIVPAAKTLPDCIIDGEAVILDKNGHSDFAALQKVLPAGHDTGVILFAFDVLSSAELCVWISNWVRPRR
jgi:bifunctional non-homologous end joining protein LigD